MAVVHIDFKECTGRKGSDKHRSTLCGDNRTRTNSSVLLRRLLDRRQVSCANELSLFMSAGFAYISEQGSVGVSTPWSLKDLSSLFYAVSGAFRCSSISHSLPFFTVRYCLVYTFRVVCSGLKLTTTVFDLRGIW